MLALFTDFGSDDLYLGQMKAVLAQHAAGIPIIDLSHNAPAFQIVASAHLLAALYTQLAPTSVICAVVDPGVGSAREAIVMAADNYYFVGPDNGLFGVIASRIIDCKVWRICWRPKALSASFHGRDLFAPVAAWIASGRFPFDKLEPQVALSCTASATDIAQIIYIDHYGNCLTGLRHAHLASDQTLSVAGLTMPRLRTFADAEPGSAFCYENSLGLVEIALNQGNAAQKFNLRVGDAVQISALDPG